ncbi:MAG: hypothetical protein HY369_05120 [Candidatus Aenigmarchaeota archaeon]|nr:hypothetical protein [Candidatus Aenigmarchaeota archaeon]
MDHPIRTVPSLYVQRTGEQSVKVALTLTRARDRVVVRLTGGCGAMAAADAAGMADLFCAAFSGFGGAMLFGGTRMVARADPRVVVPGITEIPPLVRAQNPCVILGVVPKTGDLRLAEIGMVVSDDAAGYVTIVHPDQDVCVVVQPSADGIATWDDEARVCREIATELRTSAGWQSVLIAYNGGGTTEREIRAWAPHAPVILIKGSGRAADCLGSDAAFLAAHPQVRAVPKDRQALRTALIVCGVLPVS